MLNKLAEQRLLALQKAREANKARKPSPKPVIKSTIPHEIITRSGGARAVKLTKGDAIKLFCTQCMGYESNPQNCTAKRCPLYLYRGWSRKGND